MAVWVRGYFQQAPHYESEAQMGEKEKNLLLCKQRKPTCTIGKTKLHFPSWEMVIGGHLEISQIVYLHSQLPVVRASYNYANLVMMVIASHFYARIWK